MAIDRLAALVGDLASCPDIDPDRMYLSGVSMDGMGVWSLASKRPELFAAIAPIAGGVYSPPMRIDIDALASLPIRAYNDEFDREIPLGRERPLIECLAALGGDVGYIVSQNGKHYVREDAYGDAALFERLASHMREE